jgi:hypothetical protein
VRGFRGNVCEGGNNGSNGMDGRYLGRTIPMNDSDFVILGCFDSSTDRLVPILRVQIRSYSDRYQYSTVQLTSTMCTMPTPQIQEMIYPTSSTRLTSPPHDTKRYPQSLYPVIPLSISYPVT